MVMRHKKAIMFDLDGTISDSARLGANAPAIAIKKISGVDVAFEQTKAHWGRTEEALFRAFCGDDWKKAQDDYAQFLEENVTPELIFGCMNEVLEYLKNKNVNMAVITSRGPDTAELLLKKGGVMHYFDRLKTGSSRGNIKPESMREVLSEWNQSAADTFYIGDIENDVRDAKSVGLKALACTWSGEWDNFDSLKKENPHKIFTNVADFFDFIKKEF